MFIYIISLFTTYEKKEKYLVSPNINDKSLISELNGIDESENELDQM